MSGVNIPRVGIQRRDYARAARRPLRRPGNALQPRAPAEEAARACSRGLVRAAAALGDLAHARRRVRAVRRSGGGDAEDHDRQAQPQAGPEGRPRSAEQLPPDPAADAAFERLERANMLIGVLTNGGEKETRKLLEAAGLLDRVAEIVSVEEVELYKPHPAVYKHAAERLGVEPKGVTLIAAHAWDVVGAKRAGLDAVWVDRLEREWPFPRGKPRSRVAHDLVEAAELAAAKG